MPALELLHTAVVDELWRVSESGVLAAPLDVEETAKALLVLDANAALEVLGGLCQDAAGVDDPTAWVCHAAQAMSEPPEEVQVEPTEDDWQLHLEADGEVAGEEAEEEVEVEVEPEEDNQEPAAPDCPGEPPVKRPRTAATPQTPHPGALQHLQQLGVLPALRLVPPAAAADLARQGPRQPSRPPPGFVQRPTGGAGPDSKGPGKAAGKGKPLYRYKMELCRNFLRGNCSSGADCIYAHGEPEREAALAEQLVRLNQQVTMFKTRLCIHFVNSKCSRGDQCSFAHGEEELEEAPARPRTKGAGGKAAHWTKGKGKGKAQAAAEDWGVAAPQTPPPGPGGSEEEFGDACAAPQTPPCLLQEEEDDLAGRVAAPQTPPGV